MALSLKINIVKQKTIKTLQFDPTILVQDALRIIDEKVRGVTEGERDNYGLFLEEENERGRWLEPSRVLNFYPFSSGDLLEYKSKIRLLKVYTMDGAVKTVQIDDSRTVGDILTSVCRKMGVGNSEEFSLVLHDDELIGETFKKDKGGTSMKKMEERDRRKMDEMKKKLHTDDKVQWLDLDKTLREQGIDETHSLLLKRKLFYSDQNVDIKDPVQLNLLYMQCRDGIIKGSHPCTQEEAAQLGALQIQLQFGDFNEQFYKSGKIEIKEMLPKEYGKSKGIDKKIKEEQKKVHGLDELQSKFRYVQLCRSLTTYGVTFFLVQEKMKGKNKFVPRLLGISKESVLRLDEKTKEILKTWPLTSLRRWAASLTGFTLEFGDYTESYYSVQTIDGEKISELIAGYIDIIWKERGNNGFDLDIDEESTMLEDYVTPSKGTILERQENTIEHAEPGSVALPGIMRASGPDSAALEKREMGERETQKLVHETVKCGEKKNNRLSVLFIGQGGVGKTSLKKSLLGEEFGDKEASTVGIEFDVIEVNHNNKHEAWQRAADQQYIASEEYKNLVLGKEVARRIAESLKESKAKDKDNDKESDEFGNNNGSEKGNMKETLDGRGRKAGIVSSYYEEVKSESVDKGEGGNGSRADVITKSQKYGEGNNVNQGSPKVQGGYSMSDDLKRKIKESVENYSEDTMDTVRFLFGDTGGQSVFYDIHSIMLRLRSLFILVVDLERPLDANALSRFVCEKTKKVRELQNRLEETNLDYMKKWAGTLRNLDRQRNEETEKNLARNSTMPRIIVVFTKADNLVSLNEVEKVRQKAESALMTSFREIGCDSLIVGSYVIKNTLPRSEAETRELVLLREKIFETAQEILKAQEKTPVSWLELERAFSDRLMKSKDNPCITLDEAAKLAEEFGVKETFCQAMEFFHEENILVHFGGHQPSSNLVVLDPAWLVDVLTQVITVPPDPHSGGAVKAAWNDLETKGVLCSESLPVVLERHSQKEALMNMMVMTGLICHWKEDTYLVPNMVTERMEEQQIQTVLSHCLKPSLYIDFRGDCIPLGFYTRFLLEFIKWAKIDTKDDQSDSEEDDENEKHDSTPPEFTCNFSRFTKKENGVGYGVILVRRITRIQIAILAKEWGNIAESVLSFVRGTMNIIRSTYRNYHGMRFKVGLKCDLCCEETTPCSRHQKEGCTGDDCVCILSLRHLLRKSPTCKRNKLNKRNFSELNKSPWAQAEEIDKRIQDTIPPTMESLYGVLESRKYLVVKQIGCGSCGKVYLCQTKDRLRHYAVKQVCFGVNDRETRQKVKDLKKEIQMLKRLKHNSIVAFYFYEETVQALSIFMEYVPGGSVSDYVSKNGEMEENLVRKYTYQILKGCEYLHKNDVIHRDIKGGNVLIDNAKGSIRLADFGIAKDLQRVVTSTGSTTDESFRGTIYWCSPEHLKREDPTYVFDIWSVGCTVVEMLTTKPPHRHLDYFQAMYSILNEVFHPPDHLTSLAKTFIELCFKKKEERPDATELLITEFPAEYVPDAHYKVDQRIDQDTIQPTMESLHGVLEPRKHCFVKQIGCGSCGKVYLCQTNDRLQNYAVKQVDLGANDRETQKKVKDVKKEIQMLKTLKHNNIVPFYFYEETVQTLSIFMEYVPGGSVLDYVMKNGEMEENLVRKYTYQILKGCEYLHRNNVIHRDIKGGNVLIDDANESIRLADFGNAKDLQRVVTSTGSTTDESFRGTIYWCSPEHLKEEDPTYVFDIWSVGCTVVEMLTTKPPHRDLDFFQAMHCILNEVFHLPDHLSLLAKTFIELCFKKKGERPNATELLKNEFPAEYMP